ncbi:MAG: DUF4296 domain-containing protein [Bacteroidales bacterium]
MKPIILYFTFLIFIALACSKKENYYKPQEVLTEEKLLEILWDYHYYNALIREYNYIVKPVFVSHSVYDQILKKHNISIHTLAWNLIYYTESGKIDKVYEKLLTRASTLRGELDAKRMNPN